MSALSRPEYPSQVSTFSAGLPNILARQRIIWLPPPPFSQVNSVSSNYLLNLHYPAITASGYSHRTNIAPISHSPWFLRDVKASIISSSATFNNPSPYGFIRATRGSFRRPVEIPSALYKYRPPAADTTHQCAIHVLRAVRRSSCAPPHDVVSYDEIRQRTFAFTHPYYLLRLPGKLSRAHSSGHAPSPDRSTAYSSSRLYGSIVNCVSGS